MALTIISGERVGREKKSDPGNKKELAA